MAGLKEIYLIGGLAACSGMQPSINGEDWVPQTRKLVPQLLQRFNASTPASTRTIFKATW